MVQKKFNKKEIKLPPFTQKLLSTIHQDRDDFDTPGHHQGAFYSLFPEGKEFVSSLGKSMFDADISDSSSLIGDPSSHEGVSKEAEDLAASVWESDRTFFVLGGTSASNRIALEALVAEGDLILFDRNNHKSVYQGALLQAGGIPVYLSSERNDEGIIGGIRSNSLDEETLRKEAYALSPSAKERNHPYRVACLQLSTYDGLFLDAKKVIQKLSSLCDYILFDGAWAGYENFISLLKSSAVLTFDLKEKDCGILVTHSVHKQLSGFSMTSQIHKKDSHIRHQDYYLEDDVLDHFFLMNISTSPYYPLFAGLEMNALLHQKMGRSLWEENVKRTISFKKKILSFCKMLSPFVPKEGPWSWKDHSTEEIAAEQNFHRLSSFPWNGGETKDNLYTLDPCKVLVTTGSLENEQRHSIPAPLISLYLESKGITPEKHDFYTLLFLTVPGDKEEKYIRLLSAFQEIEKAYEENKPLKELLPHLTDSKEGLKDFSKRVQHFLIREKASVLTKSLFQKESLPKAAMSGKEATQAFLKGNRKKTPLKEALGKIALEPILPYPPGIALLCAGEIWNENAFSYFLFLEKYKETFPLFSTEIVGLHEGEEGFYVWTFEK